MNRISYNITSNEETDEHRITISIDCRLGATPKILKSLLETIEGIATKLDPEGIAIANQINSLAQQPPDEPQ